MSVTVAVIGSLGILLVLLMLSAFFSGTETALMSLNRYRLRYAARKAGKRKARAQCLQRLLQRPDRVLGVILLGNTFANVVASAVVTLFAAHFFGETGAMLATVLLTIVILIFAETMPKTLAAFQPDKIAYAVSYILSTLLTILYPLVWLINGIANSLLRLFNIPVGQVHKEVLSNEELETVVHEASGVLSKPHQRMMVSILESESVRVEDIMIPRQDIIGVDVAQPWSAVLLQLQNAKHVHLPVYDQHMDQVKGVINTRHLLALALNDKLNEQAFNSLCESVYYVPESTLISKQLVNFQKNKRYMAIVVDEYGEVTGLVSIKDILEEVVGEYDDEQQPGLPATTEHADKSFTLDAALPLREIKRLTSIELPMHGPNTLSGLIIEYLQFIPTRSMCVCIDGYRMEVISMSDNTITMVRLFPRLS